MIINVKKDRLRTWQLKILRSNLQLGKASLKPHVLINCSLLILRAAFSLNLNNLPKAGKFTIGQGCPRNPLSGASIFHTYPLSQLSRIFLFWKAPPTGLFAAVYIIANHKRAVVLYYSRYMQATRKYFNNDKSAESLLFFLGCHANVSMFSREIKEPPTYLSSKGSWLSPTK